MPNDTTSQWVLANAKADVTAKSHATKVSYPLGKHEWTIYNNDCNKGKTQTPLKLTGCKEDEFTCNDGQCIKIERSQNGWFDVRFEELVSKAKNPGGFLRKNVF